MSTQNNMRVLKSYIVSIKNKLRYIDQRAMVIVICCAMVHVFFEICAIDSEQARILASRLWAISGAICFAYILFCSLWLFYSDLMRRRWVLVVLMGLLLIGLWIPMVNGQLGDISYEAALEVNGGLNSVKQPDWNYNGTAFLGYPARQYVVNALPSILFGRNVFSLHLGFGYVFIFGLLMFYIGLRRMCNNYYVNPIISMLPVFGLFLFPYLAEQYLIFEQVITPVSYTMLIIGFGLSIERDQPSVFDYFGAMWSGCMLCRIYTPALAVMGLVFVILGMRTFVWLRIDKKKGVCGGVIWMTMALYLVISYTSNQTVHGLRDIGNGLSIIRFILKALIDFMFDRISIFWGTTGFLVLLYILVSLCGGLTIYDAVVSLWVLAVIVSSVLLRGYADFAGGFVAFYHRAILCIPVVLTMLFLHMIRFCKERGWEISSLKVMPVLITCIMVALNNFTVPRPVSNTYNPILDFFVEETEISLQKHHISSEDTFNVIILDGLMGNYYDTAAYLYPNAKVYYAENEDENQIDFSLPTFVYQSDKLPDTYHGFAITENNENIRKDYKRNVEYLWYSGFLQTGRNNDEFAN